MLDKQSLENAKKLFSSNDINNKEISTIVKYVKGLIFR